MPKNKDHNTVSFWFWMFALFVMAIPCLGFVMIIVWAFAGENASRKNYFRACLAWGLILAAIWGLAISAGVYPRVEKQVQEWLQSVR